MDQKLETALSQAIEERTFSLDALKAIEQLRTANNEQQLAIEQLTSRNEQFFQDYSDLKKKLDECQAQLVEFQAEQHEYKKRERELLIQETRAECALSHLEQYREVVLSMTRNIELRRLITGMVPLVTKYADGTEYTSQVPVDTTETEQQV